MSARRLPRVLLLAARPLTAARRWQVYEERDGFTLNEAVEVFGILSVSPALGALADG